MKAIEKVLPVQNLKENDIHIHMMVGVGREGTDSYKYFSEEGARQCWRNFGGRYDFMVWVAYYKDGTHTIVETLQGN